VKRHGMGLGAGDAAAEVQRLTRRANGSNRGE
jgi:hypothetical protein